MRTRSKTKRTRENLNRLPREVEATLPSWVKCTDPISAETLKEVRSTVLVWLANVRNYVQETNQHFPYDEQPHPEEFEGEQAWVFFVETHLCTDSRAHSTLNHGEVDFEWFARQDLRRKNIVIKDGSISGNQTFGHGNPNYNQNPAGYYTNNGRLNSREHLPTARACAGTVQAWNDANANYEYAPELEKKEQKKKRQKNAVLM